MRLTYRVVVAIRTGALALSFCAVATVLYHLIAG